MSVRCERRRVVPGATCAGQGSAVVSLPIPETGALLSQRRPLRLHAPPCSRNVRFTDHRFHLPVLVTSVPALTSAS